MPDEKEKEKKDKQIKFKINSDDVAKIILTILGVILLLTLIPASIWYITIDNGSYHEGNSGNTGYVVNQKVFENTTTHTIAKNGDEWGFNINLDTIVDDIIKTLNENDGTVDNYISTANQKEYLSAFIKAELITQYPDLRSVEKIGTPTNVGEFQGCIQIHRLNSENNTQILSYIDYDTFDTYINSGDAIALDHFTINSEGDLVVAGWTRVTTNISSDVPGTENVQNKVEFQLTSKAIPYKSAVEIYSMPFDFLWALTVATSDEEFSYNVAQLALKSKIIITVHENLSVIESNNIEKYEIKEKTTQKANLSVTYNGNTSYSEYNKTIGPSNTTYTTKTNVVSESCSIKVDITYADTWLYTCKNTYINEIPEDSGKETFSPKHEVEDEDVGVEKVENIPIDNAFNISAQQALEEFKIDVCGSLGDIQSALINAKISNKSNKKYTTKTSHTMESKSKTTYNKYTQQGTPEVNEKIEKDVDMNNENFVSLLTESQTAKSQLGSAASWLFSMLENSTKTTDMIDIVKYLLNKTFEKDIYDVSVSFNFISLVQTKQIQGSSTENFIKAWENDVLWKYETNQISSVPTKYITEDGLNYIVYEDGSAGHNNIAYGWATFISDSGNAKVNHPQYGGGYYNHEEKFEAVGIDVKTLSTGSLVDKEAATSVFLDGILDECVKYVDNYLKNNLPEYEFSQAQKDALISMRYQYGNLSNSKSGFDFAKSYINSLNEDGSINAEKLKANCSRFNYTATKNDRKYANWLLFTQEKYIDRSGEEIQLGLLSSAKKIHDYMSDPEHLYYYCLIGDEKSETKNKHLAESLSCGLNHSFEESKIPGKNGYRLTCCATYVSWVLIDCGYIEKHSHNCGGLEKELVSHIWTKIENYDDLEAGDIVFMDTDGANNRDITHVQIYVGDGQWYNAGGNSSIHKVEPYSDDVRSEFVYAYRKN